MAGHKSILESIELSCTNNRHEMAIKQCTDALRSSDLTPDLACRLMAWRRNCFRNHLGEYPIHRRPKEGCGGFGVVISIDDDSRPGGKVDRGRMVCALKSVGCQKVVEECLVNQAAADMEEAMAFVMADEEENQFASVDWFVCVIMAHGKVMENVLHIKATDGEFVPVFDKLISPVVKNRHLKNKPKVFFIQACREVEQAQGEVGKPFP